MIFQRTPFPIKSFAEKPVGFTFQDTRDPQTGKKHKGNKVSDSIVWVILAVRPLIACIAYIIVLI